MAKAQFESESLKLELLVYAISSIHTSVTYKVLSHVVFFSYLGLINIPVTQEAV